MFATRKKMGIALIARMYVFVFSELNINIDVHIDY